MIVSEITALRILAIGDDSGLSYIITGAGLTTGSIFIVGRAALAGLTDLEGTYSADVLNALAAGLGFIGFLCWFLFGGILFIGV